MTPPARAAKARAGGITTARRLRRSACFGRVSMLSNHKAVNFSPKVSLEGLVPRWTTVNFQIDPRPSHAVNKSGGRPPSHAVKKSKTRRRPSQSRSQKNEDAPQVSPVTQSKSRTTGTDQPPHAPQEAHQPSSNLPRHRRTSQPTNLLGTRLWDGIRAI